MSLVIPITNPDLSLAPVDLETVSEYRDVPVKRTCDDDFCVDALCSPVCADDGVFNYFVQPFDKVWLQFQIGDTFNSDPENPSAGWDSADVGDWWMQLQVVHPDGTVLYEDDIRDISSGYFVGWHPEHGSYQVVVVDITKLQSQIGSENICFYFRAKVREALPAYTTADTSTTGAGTPSIVSPDDGLVVFNLTDGKVYTYNGGWTATDPVEGQYLYVADSGLWYLYQTGSWSSVAGAPYDTENDSFTYCATHMYRVENNCSTSVLLTANYTDRDCAGYVYAPPTSFFVRSDTPIGFRPMPFITYFRVKAVLQVEELPVARENTENRRFLRSNTSTKYRFIALEPGVPLSVAKRIQSVFAAPEFTAGGIAFEEVGDLTRNNDEGEHWYLDIELSKDECEVVPECD